MKMANEKEVQVQHTQAPAEVERTRNRRVYSPNVDILEKRDAIVLLADMPGVDDKSVNITLDKNILTLFGTVEMESLKGYNLEYAEYGMGDYQRSFTISSLIDQNKIEASVKDGVLRLILPKAEEAKARKIEVRAS
jgi:HSP20 family molecular chaperone IbpA